MSDVYPVRDPLLIPELLLNELDASAAAFVLMYNNRPAVCAWNLQDMSYLLHPRSQPRPNLVKVVIAVGSNPPQSEPSWHDAVTNDPKGPRVI